MKKTKRRLLILSIISIAFSAIAIVLLLKSHSIHIKTDSYSDDYNTYYTCVILEYICIFLCGITGVITYSLPSKWWLLYIPSALCLLSIVYATAQNGIIPLIYPTLIISLSFILIANSLSEHHKKTNT